MKSDVLTLAAIVFLVGTAVSSFGISELFESEASAPPSALQQGVVVAQQSNELADRSRQSDALLNN